MFEWYYSSQKQKFPLLLSLFLDLLSSFKHSEGNPLIYWTSYIELIISLHVAFHSCSYNENLSRYWIDISNLLAEIYSKFYDITSCLNWKRGTSQCSVYVFIVSALLRESSVKQESLLDKRLYKLN